MQKRGQDQFAVFCPSTLSRAATKWHEILGNSNLIKVLFSIAETIKRKIQQL
jgi:predicted NodU family carbamoyl transferase